MNTKLKEESKADNVNRVTKVMHVFEEVSVCILHLNNLGRKSPHGCFLLETGFNFGMHNLV